MRTYTPRRAGRKWLEGAPEYVLDCFYHKREDSFDVLFTGSLLGTIAGEPRDFAHVYVMGLDINPNGAYCSFELDAYHTARFRYRNSGKRRRWAELPEEGEKGGSKVGEMTKWEWEEDCLAIGRGWWPEDDPDQDTGFDPAIGKGE